MGLNLGIVASSKASAAPSASLLLDTYNGAAAAYSLRKLRAAYTGAAIRVSRSSDSAQMDIGFNGSGELDTITLLTFVGSGTGSIFTWYDQSGNSNNAIHTPAFSAAPRIVISGVLQTQNSKPCIRFLGNTGGTALAISTPIAGNTNISIFMTAKGDNLSNYGPLLGAIGAPTVLFGYLAPSEQNLAFIGGLNSSYKIVTTSPNFANTNFLIYNIIVNSTNFYIYQNNNTFTQTANNISPNPTSFNQIGRYFNFHSLANFSEVIFYKSDQLSNRTGIVNNTNSFYTIF